MRPLLLYFLFWSYFLSWSDFFLFILLQFLVIGLGFVHYVTLTTTGLREENGAKCEDM